MQHVIAENTRPLWVIRMMIALIITGIFTAAGCTKSNHVDTENGPKTEEPIFAAGTPEAEAKQLLEELTIIVRTHLGSPEIAVKKARGFTTNNRDRIAQNVDELEAKYMALPDDERQEYANAIDTYMQSTVRQWSEVFHALEGKSKQHANQLEQVMKQLLK